MNLVGEVGKLHKQGLLIRWTDEFLEGIWHSFLYREKSTGQFHPTTVGLYPAVSTIYAADKAPGGKAEEYLEHAYSDFKSSVIGMGMDQRIRLLELPMTTSAQAAIIIMMLAVQFNSLSYIQMLLTAIKHRHEPSKRLDGTAVFNLFSHSVPDLVTLRIFWDMQKGYRMGLACDNFLDILKPEDFYSDSKEIMEYCKP